MPTHKFAYASIALQVTLMTGFCSSAAQAQAPAEFYRNKTVTLVVGYAPGGGYDIYSRLLARHLGNHIGGAPNVIVQNMPGAAGVVASNNIFVAAPKDGTVIAAVDQNIPMFQLLDGKGVKYDATRFAWLGSMAASNGIAMTWAETGVASLEDAKRREVSMGTTGANDDAYIYARTLNALLGTRFKTIQGYSGTSSVNMALEKGEVESMGRSTYYGFASQRPDWLRDKKVNILVQFGFEKQPEIAEVPMLLDLVSGTEAKQIAGLVSMPTGIGYSHWLSPEVPADRLSTLRIAYMATLADAALLGEAKQRGIEIKPKTPEQMAQLVKDAASTPADVRAKTVKMLGWE
jgi:tripartite-type tricarboxylate transporter receptor subunit TctC